MSDVTIGNGSGTYNISPGKHGKVSVGNGSDTINISGGSQDGITIGGGNDAITVSPATGDIISVGGGADTITLSGGSNNVLTLGNGNDTVNAGTDENDIITVGAGNDTVTAGADAIVIAGDGNDAIRVGADSAIIAGNGKDTLSAGADSSVIVGNGNDTITAGADSLIAAGNGNDTIAAGADSLIAAGNGNDTLTGGGENDTIIAGGGADTEDLTGSGLLYAGSGNDLGIYTLSDHYSVSGSQLKSLHGDVDFYYGQGGSNTLELVLTAQQAALSGVQQSIASYLAFLATDPGVNQPFTFHFGAATGGLTVAGWRLLDVQVAGANTYDVAQSNQTASIAASNSTLDLSGSGDAVSVSGSSDAVTISGTDDSMTLTGGGNTVASSISNTTLSVTATDSTIDVTATDSVIKLSGSADTITLNLDPTVVDVYATDSTVTVAGDDNSVYLFGDGDTLIFDGTGNTLDYTQAGSLPDPIAVQMTASGTLTIAGSASLASTNGDRVDVATSGANPVSMTLTLEGGIIGAANGASVTQTGIGSLTVNIAPGAQITGVTGAALLAINTDTAIPLSADSTITVNANGTLTAGPDNGGPNGAITAGYVPALTQAPDANAAGNVSVNSNATINAGGGGGPGFGILAFTWGTGNVSVTTAAGSSITDVGAQGAAIGAFAFLGGTATISNAGYLQGGPNSSPDSGLAIISVAGSDVVDNSGTIYGNVALADTTFDNESGAYWYVSSFSGFGPDTSTISNAGTIVADGQAGLGAPAGGSNAPGVDGNSTVNLTNSATGIVQIGNGDGLGVLGAIDNYGAINVGSGSGNTTNVLFLVADLTLEARSTLTLADSQHSYILGNGVPLGLDNDGTISGSGNIGDETGNITLINQAGGVIDADYSDNALSLLTGATITNYGLMESTNGGTMNIVDNIDNIGTGVLLAASGDLSVAGAISGSGVLAILPGATATIGASDSNLIVFANPNDISGTATLVNMNNGDIDPSSETGNAVITVYQGGSQLIDNYGTLVGDVQLDDATVNNEGSGDWYVSGANQFGPDTSTIDNAGSIAVDGLTFFGAPNAPTNAPGLDGNGTVNLTNDGSIQVNDDGSLQVLGAIENFGLISLDAGNNFAALELVGSLTLEANSTLMLDDDPHNYLLDNGVAVTVTNNGTISGSGNIGDESGLMTLDNGPGGTVNAIHADNPLWILTGDTVTNAGLMEATGGTLNIIDNIDNEGTLLAQRDLNVNGAITGGGQIDIDPGATATIFSSTTNVINFENLAGITTGTLVDQEAGSFGLTVNGFTGSSLLLSDEIDLRQVQFGSLNQPTLDGTMLAVSDGVGDAATVNLNGFGGTLANLNFQNDGQGGTLIVDPPSAGAGSALWVGVGSAHPDHPLASPHAL